jgi:hypothetical protein
MRWTYFNRTAMGILAVILLVATGCQRPRHADSLEGVKLAWQLSPQPPYQGKATVTVDLTGKDKKPVTGAAVKIEANMSHAGMKPVFGDGKETSPGQYQVPLEFTMGGDWFLLIDVKLADGRHMTKKVDVPAVQGE